MKIVRALLIIFVLLAVLASVFYVFTLITNSSSNILITSQIPNKKITYRRQKDFEKRLHEANPLNKKITITLAPIDSNFDNVIYPYVNSEKNGNYSYAFSYLSANEIKISIRLEPQLINENDLTRILTRLILATSLQQAGDHLVSGEAGNTNINSTFNQYMNVVLSTQPRVDKDIIVKIQNEK